MSGVQVPPPLPLTSFHGCVQVPWQGLPPLSVRPAGAYSRGGAGIRREPRKPQSRHPEGKLIRQRLSLPSVGGVGPGLLRRCRRHMRCDNNQGPHLLDLRGCRRVAACQPGLARGPLFQAPDLQGRESSEINACRDKPTETVIARQGSQAARRTVLCHASLPRERPRHERHAGRRDCATRRSDYGVMEFAACAKAEGGLNPRPWITIRTNLVRPNIGSARRSTPFPRPERCRWPGTAHAVPCRILSCPGARYRCCSHILARILDTALPAAPRGRMIRPGSPRLLFTPS